MSDQAENLRQLVRAHRQWRDLAQLDLAAPGPWHLASDRRRVVNQEVIGAHGVVSEGNSCKRREERHGKHVFPVGLTMALKRLERVVRYLIGMEFLAR
jgi:hypothetical protein